MAPLSRKRRVSVTLLSLCLLLLIVQTAFGAKGSSVLLPYTKVKLENGLTLIVKEVHTSPIAAIDIWVATGAKNDPQDEAGISHFFEHMLFKGTTQRKVGEISKTINAVGGYLNAATSLDTTHYYIVVPSDQAALALDVQADAIMHSAFDANEIDKERQVILEEKRLKDDNPQARLGFMAYQAIFKGTPYEHDVLGTSSSLANINHEAFLKYHRKYYRPNHMVAVVVGDVDTQKVINQVRSAFADFKPGNNESEPPVQLPDLNGPTKIEAAMAVDQTYLLYAYPAPKLNDPDEAALSVLAVILGDGKGSLFHQKILEEKQLVTEIESGYQTFRQVGLFGIYARTQSTPVEKITDEINNILAEIFRKGLSNQELSRAKALIKSEIAYATESDANIAAIIGEYEVNGEVEDIDRYMAALDKVNAEDLKRVAKKYLLPDQAVITIVKPMEVKGE
ncbi:MAG TPA: pitrilysin family protein [Bacillota bacterium]|nr:pitrilysin family protein [Bacillota bacterium]